mmetsp:Transcript_98071/g.194154  ORF Transcript_98071/g.194154 Transcript_98071/m.194154 type:complete len:107 (-) Transcript_98071:214-534(-)
MESVLWVDSCLSFCCLAYQQLSPRSERHNARRRTFTLSTGQDPGEPSLQGGHQRIRCAKVDANHFFTKSDCRCTASTGCGTPPLPASSPAEQASNGQSCGYKIARC